MSARSTHDTCGTWSPTKGTGSRKRARGEDVTHNARRSDGTTTRATRAAPFSCRWLPDEPESTRRSFEVWLSADQLLAQTTRSSGAGGSEFVFCWHVCFEKHIPFCVKEHRGEGTLTSSSNWRSSVTLDLSRSGYGVVTLKVTLRGAECVSSQVTTIREVCTHLPRGRSMTRAPSSCSTTVAATATADMSSPHTRPAETWTGEHRWRDFAAAKNLPAVNQRAPTGALSPISCAELAEHRKVGDGWVAIDGLVVDVSHFLSHHPGGVRTLLGVLGTDATEQFNAVHPHVNVEEVMGIACCVKGRLVSDARKV